MAKLKDKITKNVSENVEESEPSDIAGRNGKWCSHFGKSLVVPQLVKLNYHMIIQSHLYTQETRKHVSTQTLVHNDYS